MDRKTNIKTLSQDSQFSDATPIRRHRPDYLIVLFMGLLMMIGLITIYAIGPQRANVLNNAYGSDFSDTYFFIKQVVSLLVALAGFFFMAFVPYTWFTRHAGKLLMIGFGACALLAVAGWTGMSIAQQTLGATRWFNLGIFGSLQPAELLKFSVLIFLAGFLGSKYKQNKLNDTHESLVPLAIITAIALLFIVVIEKDFGTGVSLVGIILSMLVMAGINWRNMAKILITATIIGVLLIVSAPHRVERIVTFLKGDSSHLSEDDGGSYQVEQAKLAIGTGGLFGVGVGNSVQSTGYLPEAINDSVFAIMGETFGFVGLMTILALFIALLMRILKLMDHMVDIRLKLLIAGVFGWFGSHVILNIASMLGVFPLTGITLPLLSFGGTSMVFIAAALGLVFQLSHYTVHTSRLKEAQYENTSSRRGIGRSRYAGRRSFTRD
ncbi:MAG: FtsW/RodA/SpoVE family cell cycle protein [Candidatus Saccharimonadales bacterium]